MYAALALFETWPPSCAGSFSRLDGSRAVRASYAGIIAIVERVIRQISRAEIAPYHFVSPIGDGIDLRNSQGRIPFNLSGIRPRGGLFAADGRDPCF